MKKNIFTLALSACVFFSSAAVADELPEPTLIPDANVETAEIQDISDDASEADVSGNTSEISQPQESLEENFEADVSEGNITYQTEDIEINNISNTIDFDIIMVKHEYPAENFINLELYSMDDTFLADFTEWIDGETDVLRAHFDVPEYTLGESFKLKLVSGISSLKYYDTVIYAGQSVTVQTYGYLDENNIYFRGDEFALEGDPYYEKGVNIYIDDGLFTLSPRARLVDGNTMVPVRQVGEALGLNIKYDKDYDSVVCSFGENEVIFNVGTTYSTIFGETVYAPHEPCYIEGSIYVPVRTLAEAIDSSITVYDFGEHLDVVLGDSTLVKEFRNSSPVNRNGIDSRTDYLIWVSKSEFTTRVYLGSKYNWTLIQEFPCAIGASDSETVTGQFEYIEQIPSWDYATYYVGPVLRFYNGYALHSTLLYYGGGEYDGTVGKKVSHGCVRLHPDDINWLNAYIPLGTKIYITE